MNREYARRELAFRRSRNAPAPAGCDAIAAQAFRHGEYGHGHRGDKP